MSVTADVGVIGIGTAGSVALWQLARRGASVHGFEQFGIGHDRSAMGGETRLIRTASLLDPRYVSLARRALGLWRQLEAESGRNVLTQNGHLVMGPSDSPGLSSTREFASAFDLDHEVLDVRDAERRFPQHVMDDGDVVLLDKEGGFLRTDLSVPAATDLATARGGIAHRHTPIIRLETDRSIPRIVTADGEYRFRKAIVAAGPWFADVLLRLAKKLVVKRVVQAWFATRSTSGYDPASFPVFLRTGLAGRVSYFYGVPQIDGVGVKLGVAGSNRVIPCPDQLDRAVSGDDLANFSSVVTRYLPGLPADPIRACAYMEPYTPDSTALVGPVPDNDAIIALGGFSGHGFKFAPVMGELAAQYAAGDEPEFSDARMFLPNRSLPDWGDEEVVPQPEVTE